MVFTAAPPAGQTLHFCTASSVFYSSDRFSLLVVDHQRSEQIQKHCSALWVMYEMYQPHLFPESAAASCGIKELTKTWPNTQKPPESSRPFPPSSFIRTNYLARLRVRPIWPPEGRRRQKLLEEKEPGRRSDHQGTRLLDWNPLMRLSELWSDCQGVLWQNTWDLLILHLIHSFN